MLDRLGYFFRRALRNMRQSPVLCAAAVGTVAVSLTLVAFFAIIVLNVQKLTGTWSKEVQVVTYLDSVPEKGLLKGWIAEVEGLPEVEGVTFVSRQEAFQRFKKRLAGDGDLLNGLEPEILPASLEVALKAEYRTRQGVESVVAKLKNKPHFTDLRYGQDWLERFESFISLLRLAGGILGGFLLFAALFIVSNTIKLTLYARRAELEIMSLVGGTPLFIKTPFLIEGALQGAAGALAALGTAYLLFRFFLREGLTALLLTTGVDGVAFLPFGHQLLLLAAGVGLGFAGSLLSLRKFVRV